MLAEAGRVSFFGDLVDLNCGGGFWNGLLRHSTLREVTLLVVGPRFPISLSFSVVFARKYDHMLSANVRTTDDFLIGNIRLQGQFCIWWPSCLENTSVGEAKTTRVDAEACPLCLVWALRSATLPLQENSSEATKLSVHSLPQYFGPDYFHNVLLTSPLLNATRVDISFQDSTWLLSRSHLRGREPISSDNRVSRHAYLIEKESSDINRGWPPENIYPE